MNVVYAKPPSDLPDAQVIPDPARDKHQYHSFSVENKKVGQTSVLRSMDVFLIHDRRNTDIPPTAKTGVAMSAIYNVTLEIVGLSYVSQKTDRAEGYETQGVVVNGANATTPFSLPAFASTK